MLPDGLEFPLSEDGVIVRRARFVEGGPELWDDCSPWPVNCEYAA